MTFSLIVRDVERGEIGVAICTHFLASGAAAIWAEPGRGAAATQAFTNPAHGPRGLDLLPSLGAEAALTATLALDDGAPWRQVMLAGVAGPMAAHTGARCISWAEETMARTSVASGNMLAAPGVTEAMVTAADDLAGPVATRLVVGLRAGLTAGGDIRGVQSAALRVVTIEPPGSNSWGVISDLRVDDATDPLGELGRLVELSRTYQGIKRLFGGLEARCRGGQPTLGAPIQAPPVDHEAATQEVAFWSGLALAAAGDVMGARVHLGPLITHHDSWSRLLIAAGKAGLADPEIVEALGMEGLP